MIFSGHVTHYKCPACRAVRSDVIPTSLVPMAAVIGLTAAPWTRVAGHFVSARWAAVLIGIAIAVLCLLVVYWVVDTVTTWKLRRGICPKCGANTERDGQGWYHGIVPNRWEMFIYVLSLAIAFAAAHGVVGS
jgi:hypothetical protein